MTVSTCFQLSCCSVASWTAGLSIYSGNRSFVIICTGYFTSILFLKYFLMWTVLWSLYWIYYNIASVLCFGFLASEACGNLSSPTRDQTCTPCIRKWNLNHWTIREVPISSYFFYFFIFNYRIIALQHCVGFCHTSVWMSHRNPFIPSPLSLCPTSVPIPPL